jgi:hypothetical protein
MAIDALDSAVVVDTLTERVLGRRYRLTDRIVDTYLLVNDFDEATVALGGV